jgi:hypothetical protein
VLSPGREREKRKERWKGESSHGQRKEKERENILSGFLMGERWDNNEILCGQVVRHSVLHPVLINIVVLICFFLLHYSIKCLFNFDIQFISFALFYVRS